MIRSTVVGAGWTVDVWEDPSGVISQDSSLVRPAGSVLRVAAIDGCTPTGKCASALGLDGAAYAAQIVRAALSAEQEIPAALHAAHQHLHQPGLAARDNQHAAVAAADILPNGSVSIARAADCDVWVRYPAGEYRPAINDDMLTADVRRALTELETCHAGAGFNEHVQALESRLLTARTRGNIRRSGCSPRCAYSMPVFMPGSRASSWLPTGRS